MELNYSDPELQFNAEEFIREVTQQREEILEAFIAKYSVGPEEVEQVIENTPTQIIWYVRKKSDG